MMLGNIAHNCQFVTLKRRLKQYRDQTQNQKCSPCSNKLLLNILFLGNSYEKRMFLRRVGGYLLTKQRGMTSQNNVIIPPTMPPPYPTNNSPRIYKFPIKLQYNTARCMFGLLHTQKTQDN